jgi:Zn-finger nucleic acid-binding protein
MRDAPLRLSCPACLGVVLEPVTVVPGLDVHHCGRCGGTRILREQTARLRAEPAAAVRATLARRADASFACHGCHAPMERDHAACPSCGWRNRLECPECGAAMRPHAEGGVTVDVCRGCRAVWLDHHELKALWAVAAAGAVAHAPAAGYVAGDAGGFLLDVLWYAPDLAAGALHATVHAAGAGVEAAAHVPELVGAAPELVAVGVEAAGEAAGSVFGFIAEIIAGIFEGF